MSETLNVTIHNVLTKEIDIQPMTADEIAAFEEMKTKEAAAAEQIAAKQAARQAVLDKLGLTAEDIAALGL
jgi:hypothetical protein